MVESDSLDDSDPGVGESEFEFESDFFFFRLLSTKQSLITNLQRNSMISIKVIMEQPRKRPRCPPISATNS